MRKIFDIIFRAPVYFALIYVGIILLTNLIDIFYPLGIRFYIYLFFSWAALLSGYCIAFLIPSIRLLSIQLIKSRNLINFVLFLVFLNTVFALINYYGVMGLEFDLHAYRMYLTLQHNPVLLIKYSAVLNFSSFALLPTALFSEEKKITWVKYGIIAVLLLILGILSTSRSFFVILLLLFGLTYLLKNGVKIKYLLLIIIFGIFFFFLVPIMVNKVADLETLWIYLLGGVHALNQIIEGVRPDPSSSVYSFSFIAAILSKFHLIEPRPFLGYLCIPQLTNVYTLLGVLYLDYGYIGSLIGMSIIGLLSGIIDKFYILCRSARSIYLKAWNLTIISLSFFYDYYTCSTVFLILFLYSFLLDTRSLKLNE